MLLAMIDHSVDRRNTHDYDRVFVTDSSHSTSRIDSPQFALPRVFHFAPVLVFVFRKSRGETPRKHIAVHHHRRMSKRLQFRICPVHSGSQSKESIAVVSREIPRGRMTASRSSSAGLIAGNLWIRIVLVREDTILSTVSLTSVASSPREAHSRKPFSLQDLAGFRTSAIVSYLYARRHLPAIICLLIVYNQALTKAHLFPAAVRTVALDEGEQAVYCICRGRLKSGESGSSSWRLADLKRCLVDRSCRTTVPHCNFYDHRP
ncbi:uncharacterized protein MYCFIDRAFT_172431 [Pseudocercospora fijiensis CIRAD86]|uniref:Uncharacterized protein n=1 Tax=Pseudocercospora fijiensis (strain CIRAD86) TaxID=383855 RepID=M2ZA75_PSEFD|nr:uncharacterized protein MYCFIDRAFT_172431 [Pseudocercospora fijiensis CIRAD86]EME86735.1 hypothetical protein MYCFIDRAFT_172431 [Pseudocercospora fijiensis CIRAD86]